MSAFVKGRRPSWQRQAGESTKAWQNRVFRQWEVAVGEVPDEGLIDEAIYDLLGDEYVSDSEVAQGIADELDYLDDLIGEELPEEEPETYADLFRAVASYVESVGTAVYEGEELPEAPEYYPISEGGAVYWASFYETRSNANQLAEEVVGLLGPGRYSVSRRFACATYTEGPDWSDEEEVPFSRRDHGGKKHKAGEVGVLRRVDITAGVVEYLITSFWDNISQSRSVSAVLFVLHPVAAPGPWLPMRAGEVNCFVAAVRKYYNGEKATKARTEKLAALESFEVSHRDSGVRPEDLGPLSKTLRARFVFWGIDGVQLEAVGAAAPRIKEFHLVRHNGHCWLKDELPPMPPREGRKLVPIPEAPDEIESTLGAARSSWVLEQAALVLKPGERAWQVGEELVTDGGLLLRAASATDAIREAAAKEGVTEDEALLEVGGVQSFRFRRWAARNGLRTVAHSLAKVMSQAQVEAKVWNCQDEYRSADHYELDMRAAYLGCEDPALGRSRSECAPYLERFRMPHADGRMTWSAVRDLSQVEALQGSFVRFGTWRFTGPDFLRLYEEHLETHDGMIPTPLAIALRDLGFLAEHTLREVAVSFEPAPLLAFLPDEKDKDMSVRFIGNCFRRPRLSLVFTDVEESKYFYGLLASKGARPTLWKGGGLHAVDYDDPEGVAKYPHVRAYVLAYMHVAVLMKLAKHPSAVRVAVDSITLRGEQEPDPDEEVKWGEWRVKEAPKPWSKHCFSRLSRVAGSVPFPEGARPPPLPVGLYDAPLVHLDGQGGSGKTTMAIRAFTGRKVAILCKDWLGVLDAEEKLREASVNGVDITNMSATTYHTFWHVGFAKEICAKNCGKCFACKGWDPVTMGDATKGSGLPEVVVWDEPGYAPGEKLVRPVLAYCRSKGVRVIASGDILGQQRQFRDRGSGDPEVQRILVEAGAKVVMVAGDRRSLCDDLKTLKVKIWRSSEKEQITSTIAALSARGRVGGLPDALKAWHPRALVAVCTNEEGVRLQEKLLEQHMARFPNHPIPMRFAPSESARKSYHRGDYVEVPSYLCRVPREVPAVVGHREWIPAREALSYLRTEKDPPWVYDGWRTIHGLQGHTVSCETDDYDAEHSLFILAGGLGAAWNKNATYTAVSRVRYLRQLYWVWERL